MGWSFDVHREFGVILEGACFTIPQTIIDYRLYYQLLCYYIYNS
jgi:hypothetical protein